MPFQKNCMRITLLTTRAVFTLDEDTKKWTYENLILYEIEDDRWQMQYKMVSLKMESVYDAISYITNRFQIHPVFKLPRNMDDVPSRMG